MNLDFLLKLALDASHKAYKAILKEKQKLEIWQKDDGSPLSSADLASNEILCDELGKSDIAVCSEEKPLNFNERKNLPYFWLIDPLDGTKSFIKGSDEYCILIALIAHTRPILSLIAKPSVQDFYYAHAQSKLYKNDSVLVVDEELFLTEQKTALISTHHSSPLNQAFLEKNSFTPKKVSSALKFITLLDGKAGIYHRFENLHSWDIAAGDFLLNKSGGFMGKFSQNHLKNYKNSTFLSSDFISYNEENFLCPHFVAVSRQEFLKEIIL